MDAERLDGPRLRRGILAAAAWVEAGRDALNRINVFPVPDGDTGTNLALTIRGVAAAVRPLRRAALPEVAGAMAAAGLSHAHGNSGMLLSQFLIGFRDGLGRRDAVSPQDLAAGFRAGADRLEASLDDPVEGTILTVCRDTAQAAEAAADTPRWGDFMRRTLDGARASLARTPNLLEALRTAGVVDAGGQGFVRMLEGIVRWIEGAPPEPVTTLADISVAAHITVAVDHDFQFCTEVLVAGPALPNAMTVRAALRPLGGSIVVSADHGRMKVHVHTDTPDAVFTLAESWGAVETRNAQDMRAQHDALAHDSTQAMGLVVDSSCDLPDATVDRLGIVIVPVQVMDATTTYQDRVDIRAEEVYRRMREGGAVFTTSQPPPGAFTAAFADALQQHAHVLCLTLSSALSGTFGAAQAAAAALDPDRITVFDSRSLSAGLGMLTVYAHALAAAGYRGQALIDALTAVRNSGGAVVSVDRFEHLMRSGRVSWRRGLIGNLLRIKPILHLSHTTGRVEPIDRVWGRRGLLDRVLTHLDARLDAMPGPPRLAVTHAGVPDVAATIRDRLISRYGLTECLVVDATPALGVHVGPGAWGIFYQYEPPVAPPPPE